MTTQRPDSRDWKSRLLGAVPHQVWWIGGGSLAVVLAVAITWQVAGAQRRAEKTRLEGEIAQAQAHLDVLETRRLLHQTILQLEARNFGTAQEVAARATEFLAAGLKAVEQEAGPKDDLLTTLRNVSISVDPDVGSQVAALTSLAQKLDELFPVPETPHGLTSPPANEQGAADASAEMVRP